jgi:hypothetical protein
MLAVALRRLVCERLFYKLPLYEVTSLRLLRKRACICLRRCPNKKKFLKAGSERHTSTKYFAVLKTSAGVFRERHIQRSVAPSCQVPHW